MTPSETSMRSPATESSTTPDARPAVSRDEVRHVAELANLQLTADEEASLAHDLNRVLDYIAQLNEVPTEGVTPMAQASELLGEAAPLSGAGLRPDQTRPSVDRAAVLKSAPETDGRFFKVPKVIER